MSYRFQHFTTIYQAVAAQLLAQLPNHSQLSYRELYEATAGLHFGWSDYYARHMRALCYETDHVFTNFEPLQKAWANEHGFNWNSRTWWREIAIAQVRAFQPEIVFLEDLFLFDAEFRQQVREACRSRTFMVGYHAAPTSDFSAFRDMDLLLTCVPNFAARLKQSGVPVALLRHAFEPEIFEVLGSLQPRDLDFTFTGHIVLRDGYHQQRREIIERLLENTPLQMWAQISVPPTRTARLTAGFSNRANRALQQLGVARTKHREPRSAYATMLEQRFPGRSHAPVFGLDNFRLIGRSRVTFNNHIDAAEGHAGNMRLFEATGMGACLLTDWKTDLGEIFEPDKEVVAYRSADECIEKVKYLLAHDSEREQIAAAGQRRTLRDHTFGQRAAQLDDILRNLIANQKLAHAAISFSHGHTSNATETSHDDF